MLRHRSFVLCVVALALRWPRARASRAACAARHGRRLRRHAQRRRARRSASSRSIRPPPSCCSPSARAVASSDARRTTCGPSRRALSPISVPASARTSRRCSPRIPISSCSTRATTTATPRVGLRAAGVPTAAFRVDRIADFERVTRALGRAHRRLGRARAPPSTPCAARSIACAPRRRRSRDPTVFWPLYDQPLLATGGGSFLNELIDIAGGRNIYGFMKEPSPRVTFEDLMRAIPTSCSRRPSRARAISPIRGGRRCAPCATATSSSSTRRSCSDPDRALGEAARSIALLLHPGSVR